MQFEAPTIMVSGAVLQIFFFCILPTAWAVVPTCFLILNSVVTTLIQSKRARSNQFMNNVIPGRTMAQIPSEETGQHGNKAANGSVVVFHVGIQFNHPLGFLAPGAQDVVAHFRAIGEDLQAHRVEYGVLSISSDWKGSNRDSLNTMMNTYYFKDLDGLHKFAQGPIHRKAWDWYRPKQMPHIGVFHEAFVVPSQSYETVYVNCHPTLMGRAASKCDTADGEKYVNTLVDADTPMLKSMYARMGRDKDGMVIEEY